MKARLLIDFKTAFPVGSVVKLKKGDEVDGALAKYLVNKHVAEEIKEEPKKAAKPKKAEADKEEPNKKGMFGWLRKMF
jgi:hypothetical protein